MIKRFICIVASLYFVSAYGQDCPPGIWRAALHRSDSIDITFNFYHNKVKDKPVLYIINGSEKIHIKDVRFVKDSVFIKMPVFESSFKGKVSKGKIEGTWTRGSSSKDIVLPFTATPSPNRFAVPPTAAKYNVTGRWQAYFATDASKEDASVAEFTQKGNKVTGTFVTPSGDYRYLEGVISGNKLMLSTFDGAHAFLFTATIDNNNTISNGMFYSGPKYKEGFTAVRNAKAKVNTDAVSMYLKPGDSSLNFHFPDLSGKDISIKDVRFKNKVVVIQILGSWCPNCMDETAFLSEYYNKQKPKDVEIVALAYEYSTDFKRSVNSISKFKDRFDVKYPILVTGVTVSDTLRTEKTLPQVTPIKVFPSTIFLDKKGHVKKFDTGFFGPGTGSHYEDFKKEFFRTIDELRKEP